MKIVVVAGARPNFMKIAPILESLSRHPEHQVLLVHTGQHYNSKMSDEIFDDLGIRPPDINLGVGSGTHAEQTGRVMVSFEQICVAERPDWVVVVGDVNSTVACAITAKKLGISVAHVEAGLRSRDMSMPEEINRLCTDSISDLLFTTDRLADANLIREGACPERIHFVGNTMIDTLRRNLSRAQAAPLPCGLSKGDFAVLTLHRPANVDDPKVLQPVMDAIHAIAEGIPIVFPVHPRTLANLTRFGLRRDDGRIRYMEPLSYLPFIGLVANSRMVLTDSGGIQEETTVLGIPCLTMRPNTERPITCDVGSNILVGTDPVRIREAAMAVLNGNIRQSSVPDKWDGRAADRIVDVLLRAQ